MHVSLSNMAKAVLYKLYVTHQQNAKETQVKPQVFLRFHSRGTHFCSPQVLIMFRTTMGCRQSF